MTKPPDTKSWFARARRVIDDDNASDWLKNALLAGLNRHPEEAWKDAHRLCDILRLRAKATNKSSRKADNGGREKIAG
jgi:hypothetical protein